MLSRSVLLKQTCHIKCSKWSPFTCMQAFSLLCYWRLPHQPPSVQIQPICYQSRRSSGTASACPSLVSGMRVPAANPKYDSPPGLSARWPHIKRGEVGFSRRRSLIVWWARCAGVTPAHCPAETWKCRRRCHGWLAAVPGSAERRGSKHCRFLLPVRRRLSWHSRVWTPRLTCMTDLLHVDRVCKRCAGSTSCFLVECLAYTRLFWEFVSRATKTFWDNIDIIKWRFHSLFLLKTVDVITVIHTLNFYQVVQRQF